MNGRVGAVACAVMMGVASRLSSAQKPSGKADDDVSALPLHTVAAKTSPALALAVMLTGDGGWSRLDRRIADDLAAHGVGVVGLDSRAYLMQERTPDEAAADIARVIRRYASQWSSPRVTLIGYSRGADIAPFIVNRLPADLRQSISLVALLGPAERADFQFLPELERLRGTPVLCVYGKDEKESLCRLADSSAVRVDRRSGRHHFDGDYDAIATEILSLMSPQDAKRP